ncbi:MAG TPA: TIGR00730 family Rossman fold protein [Candidatus Paceibacterota bacterium]|nr:TIGR00730 family Rossman fold protein [Candidatus Paceibacterota bacterium]
MQADKDNQPFSNTSYVPVTLHQVEEEIRERIHAVNDEMIAGFNLIKRQPKSVSIFGSSRFPETNKYYKDARELSGMLAKKGFSVVTGGGPGIMEAANRGASEHHGHSIGLNIKLPYEQHVNPYINHGMQFNYFFIRKVMLTFSAEAYIFFPGGFGTMDEFFEIATLVQTRKIEKVPMVLYGTDFWNPLIDFMKRNMFPLDTIDPDDLNLFMVTDSLEDIAALVEHVPVRNGVRIKKTPLP